MKELEIPIAMFHHVSNRRDWSSLHPFVIKESTFTKFLDQIERSNIITTTLSSLSDGKTASKRVVLTFDDCGKHLLDFAVPELLRRNMKAVFFMPTANIGGVNTWNIEIGQSEVELMHAADLRELQGYEMEIGAHSHDHIHLARVDRLQCAEQLQRSQQTLSDILGNCVTCMAYPFGSIPDNPQELLENAGFRYGCAIFSPAQSFASMRRFIVHDGDSRASMRLKTHPLYMHYRKWKDARMMASAWT